MNRIRGAHPISGEDLSARPVKAIGPAVEFHPSVLGFSVLLIDEARAVVRRDDARLELVRASDHPRLNFQLSPRFYHPPPSRAIPQRGNPLLDTASWEYAGRKHPLE